MSTMTPTKSKSKKKSAKKNKALAQVFREAEAPDRGAERREAPDSGRLRIAEAPDAGDGRRGYNEQEFTHGRSQS